MPPRNRSSLVCCAEQFGERSSNAIDLPIPSAAYESACWLLPATLVVGVIDFQSFLRAIDSPAAATALPYDSALRVNRNLVGVLWCHEQFSVGRKDLSVERSSHRMDCFPRWQCSGRRGVSFFQCSL